ncbi:MAG: hypothetical protein PHI66_03640 [Candidatus Pacebacteria bacterium]|nr:hypothetical protein [Candidatus Paceibacterota bacterium]
MERKFLKKITLLWIALSFLAVINGTARIFIYQPIVGDLLAHQISTLIFIAVIFAVVFLLLKREEKLPDKKDLLSAGAYWLCWTVTFEFIFGHFVFGNSWEKLFADYNIFAGRIWVLVLLTTFAAPYLIGKHLERNKNQS